MRKVFHIWDFDGRDITIKLNKEIQNRLKRDIKKKFGNFYALGKAINIHYVLIHQTFCKERFPLYIAEKIMESVNISKSCMEAGVSAYSAYKGRKWIYSPILPIRKCPEVYELLGHILGDGHISIQKGKNSGYTNTSKKLIEDFELLVKKVFGNVNLKRRFDRRFGAFQVTLPRAVSLFFSRQFPEILNKEVTTSLLKANKKNISSFLRAVADDESCVCTSEIRFTLKGRKELESIRELMIKTGFKDSWLTDVRQKGDVHIFSVKGVGLLYFKEAIGFKHPHKSEQLDVEIKRKTEKRKLSTFDQTRKEINNLLVSPKSPKSLSNAIGVESYRIRKHLKEMERDGNIKIISYAKYNVPLWIKVNEYQSRCEQRRERILVMLNNSRLSTKEIANKLCLSKDAALGCLHELEVSKDIKHEVEGKTYFWVTE